MDSNPALSGPEQSPPQAEPELMHLFGSTSWNGLTIGSPVYVPDGFAGVIVVNNKPLDEFGPGQYILDAGTFPRMAQHLKLQPGQTVKAKVDIAVYLMNVVGVSVTWRAYPIVTRNATYGMTCCILRGDCLARVASPGSFYSGFQGGIGAALKAMTPANQQAVLHGSMGTQAMAYVKHVIASAAGVAVERMRLAPEQLPTAREGLQSEVAGATIAAFQSVGLDFGGLRITNDLQAWRAPCSRCRSTEAPTAYATYRRTISLLYVRLGARREGNFCVPCAARVSAEYNGVMLVCGWWGIIGVILTPIYLAQNCYYFLRTAFGPKYAATAPLRTSDPGAWPPPPASTWGQEIKE